MRAATARFAAIWIVWIVGVAPLANWMIGYGRTGGVGAEFIAGAALLVYFAAPYLLIAWLE